MCVEHSGNGESNGCVSVVAAGMHGPRVLGCIFCSSVFSDRQSIHVKAQQKSWSGLCTFEKPHNTCLANTLGDFDTQAFEFLRDNTTGADLAESEFGMHVKVTAQSLSVREKFFSVLEEIRHGRLLLFFGCNSLQ
jgi:hypothetical protein